MATSKEFNKLYDQGIAEVNKLRKAESMAWNLGYSANYCDGMGGDDYDSYKKEIDKLVGKEWPESVKSAYKDGASQGYWDT